VPRIPKIARRLVKVYAGQLGATDNVGST